MQKLMVNPKKLLHSKWTAVQPVNKEKHFLVTEVQTDANEVPQTCTLQAVHSGAERTLHWREFKDASRWLQGWI
jgi:tryptophan-rich hypothetical protein